MIYNTTTFGKKKKSFFGPNLEQFLPLLTIKIKEKSFLRLYSVFARYFPLKKLLAIVIFSNTPTPPTPIYMPLEK